jgi:hypothetical protein
VENPPSRFFGGRGDWTTERLLLQTLVMVGAYSTRCLTSKSSKLGLWNLPRARRELLFLLGRGRVSAAMSSRSKVPQGQFFGETPIGQCYL